MWATERLHVKSKGDDDVLDLTRKLQDAVERLVPREAPYRHEETWPQVVLIDFDVRPRQREIVLQLSGEKS
jgi:thiamine phosphate synthase YjbQ (UPF0047 family)